MDALGLKGGWMAYFASRAAPFGAVPDCWRLATPDAILAAREAAVDAALRRLLGDLIWSDELAEAAGLARVAASSSEAPGRPLFAANAALAWPEAPHLVLWSAATRLREHRSDGHIAVLVVSGVDPCECYLLRAAAGAFDPASQRRLRGWSEDEWLAARHRLQIRGWLRDDGSLTAGGELASAAVEAKTDELASPPWRQLYPRQIRRLHELMTALSGQIVAGGGVPIPNPVGLRWPPRESDLFDAGFDAET